ncbi:MAG TPA: hypothetical protein PLH19_06890 [Anaerolineae bacterium]|nr:hypothetical protein [Anaerolineae bacterium]HQH38248.1 hypothetical protein [Anaerolineae bacterium]
MDNETQLWAWFLFHAGFAPQRAKTLLAAWEQRDLTLRDVLEKPSPQTNVPGITPDEVSKLRPPHKLPDITALRWNEALYPVGLHHLPLQLRPALLFYRGELSLLLRPIVYLMPGPLDAETYELLQETVGILLGENLLLAAFRESPQATVLMEEMAASEGEALLFAGQGLAQLILWEQEQALLQDRRLLILSPLPPHAPANPAWDDVLQQVATAAALRRVCSNTTTPLPASPATVPTLLLTANAVPHLPDGVHVAASAVEALMWLTEIPAAPVSAPQQMTSALDLTAELPMTPPPTPAEALQVLEKGGRVPEVLKKRLLGH